jgi:2-polyprenyl-6-hydroxyphenyl methylase/3-demethylubiquinone-9 3-methyltransferase
MEQANDGNMVPAPCQSLPGMRGYYETRLAAESLRRCYELASARVQQYLRAEIDYVVERLRPDDTVLELGCGYGRVMVDLSGAAAHVVGIDTSKASLELARRQLADRPNCLLARMDASHLAFVEGSFDVVVCVQNGLSAFHADRRRVVREALRVTCQGGKVFFSTYSDRFWEPRLAWFARQADAGLIGEIDYERTGEGTIVCRDGFQASTIGPEEFGALLDGLDVELAVTEVDTSSLFYGLVKRREPSQTTR